MADRWQYRVTWERCGSYTDMDGVNRDYVTRKRKTFYRRKVAEKWVALLGPEPWVFFGKGPDDPACSCNEHPRDWDPDESRPDPSCERCDLTQREWTEKKRADLDLPPITSIRLTRRALGAWETVDV